MGEKIRDIQEITIGKNHFMVELNEGYNISQGRVIHVQNKHFRYLFTENEFLQICSAVIRSGSKLSETKKKQKITPSLVKTENVLNSDKNISEEFTNLLRQNDIEYRILESGKEYVTVLVRPECRKHFEKVMSEYPGFVSLHHPFDKFFGYSFLHQMHEFKLYHHNNTYIEIFYELPCHSLKKKTWIPLDCTIQERIWSINKEDCHIDQVSYIIFRLCWAIFVDYGFSDSTLSVLMDNVDILKSEEFITYLKLVFFGFTDTLVKMLKEKQYNQIIEAYFSFVEY